MPLAFNSLSHGEIAFGFFNIETDLLLLNRYFFFASDFCTALIRAAWSVAGEWETVLAGYALGEDQVGNLLGAIHGFDFRGFIGEVYRLYPFPRDPEGFKQNPEGFRTRPIMEETIKGYGPSANIPLRYPAPRKEGAIGEYRFDQENFQALIHYVWLGGYPRWRDGRRPEYVEALKRTVEKSNFFPFNWTGLP